MWDPGSPSAVHKFEDNPGIVTLATYKLYPDFESPPSDGFGTIYKLTPIESDTGSTGYVGRTTQSLYKRLGNHACSKRREQRSKQKPSADALTPSVEGVATSTPNMDPPRRLLAGVG